MVDVVTNFTLIAGLITGFAVVAFAIWNASRKITTVEKNQDAMDEAQTKDINILNTKLAEYNNALSERIHVVERDIVAKILEQRAERKEEIGKWGLNNKSEFSDIQKQLDEIKSDIKDIASRITVVNTKADDFEVDLTRTCNDISEVKRFFADWIQRVEDRVETARREINDKFNK